MKLAAREILVRLAVVLLLPLVMAAVSRAGATAEPLRVEPFPGYCPIDHGHPAERTLFENVARTQGGINEVIQIQVACGQLERARAGEKVRPYPNLVVLAQLDEAGNPRQIDTERGVFLDEVEKALAGQQGKDLLSQGAEASQAQQQEMLEVSRADSQSDRIHFAGPVTRDDVAVYVTSMQRHWVGNETYNDAGASATSTVDGFIVTVGLHRVYDGSQTFDPQIEEVRRMMRALISLNEGAP